MEQTALHFLIDDDAHALVDRLKAALPVGSTLAISHGTPDFDPEGLARVARIYAEAGSPIRLRTQGEIAAFFAGWDLVEPGVVATRAWRPDPRHRRRSLHLRGPGPQALTGPDHGPVARAPRG
ncbi:SAM-dependent methyltransferase [Streptomyces sp. LE64]|uniref:SAM-dependent methyltransferase n=1 Tax=Streptomyces sp. LE64 TaxID=3448653 RepID=UPI0040421D9C